MLFNLLLFNVISLANRRLFPTNTETVKISLNIKRCSRINKASVDTALEHDYRIELSRAKLVNIMSLSHGRNTHRGNTNSVHDFLRYQRMDVTILYLKSVNWACHSIFKDMLKRM